MRLGETVSKSGSDSGCMFPAMISSVCDYERYILMIVIFNERDTRERKVC